MISSRRSRRGSSSNVGLLKNAHLRRSPCLLVDRQALRRCDVLPGTTRSSGFREPRIWVFLSNPKEMSFSTNCKRSGPEGRSDHPQRFSGGTFLRRNQDTLGLKRSGKHRQLFPHLSENRHLKREEGADRPSGLIPDASFTSQRGNDISGDFVIDSQFQNLI